MYIQDLNSLVILYLHVHVVDMTESYISVNEIYQLMNGNKIKSAQQ